MAGAVKGEVSSLGMAERLCTPAPPEEEMEAEAAPDTGTLISRLKELTESAQVDLLHDAAEASNSEDVIEGCLNGLLNVRHEMELDDNLFVSLGPENSEAFLMQLKTELMLVEEKKRQIDSDIASLLKTINQDSAQLYSDLQVLEYSLKLSSSMDVLESQSTTLNCKLVHGDLHGGLMCAPEGGKFKILQLDHQIEEANHYLSYLESFNSVLRRNEAIGQVEGILSEEVTTIEFEGNWIRLSIRTPISLSDGFFLAQKLDSLVDPLVLYHELAIQVSDKAVELRNMEISPNDVCLDNIISAANSSRQLFSLHSTQLKSSLEWLVRKVKQQIFLCNVRRLIVKDSNDAWHSFEYLDKDGTITVHSVRGIDAIIKVSEAWPLSHSALHLVSIKSSDIHLRGVSLSSFQKIKERANLLDHQIRCHLLRFADAVEELLIQEMTS